MDLTFKDIQEWVKSNPDSKEYKDFLAAQLQAFLKSENGQTFLFSEEGKTLYKPEIDRRVTQAIKTYEEKTVPAKIKEAVDAKLKEINPEESPLEKRMRAIEEENTALKNQAKKDRLSKLFTKKCAEAKLTPFANFSDSFLGEDEEATLSNFVQLQKTVQEVINEAVKEKLEPRDLDNRDLVDENAPGFKDPFSKEYWNVTEQGNLFKKNPTLFKTLRDKAVSKGILKS